MDANHIKDKIVSLGDGENCTVDILCGINNLINNKGTLNLGRDLIIRVLAKFDNFNAPEQKFINSLVRNVGLFPYISDEFKSLSIQDKIAFELHKATSLGDGAVFHSLQAKVYNLLMEGRNVVLSAATSVGKSLIIDALVATRKFRTVVVIVPTIALIDETRRRLAKKFSSFSSIITHPSQKPVPDLVNVYVLTQERVLQRDDLAHVDLFIIDEFYKLDINNETDQARAIDLNLAFHKLSRARSQFYLLGPNISSVIGLDNHDFVFVASDFSTVAVDVVQFNLPFKGSARMDRLVQLCRDLTTPTIIYCQSPASANIVANALVNGAGLKKNAATEALANWIADNFHAEWDICKAIQYGIGIHHGGVPRALQQQFIKLFNEKKIQFLICTSTIIEGVNTSAENVIIFDRRKHNKVIDHFTYKNILGRAGRMGQYFVGKVFMLEEPPPTKDLSVTFPIGVQDENSPLSLLMELDQESLSDLSKSRLSRAYQNNNLLSRETLIANRQVSVDIQNSIAVRILENAAYFDLKLGWKGVPSGPELETACDLVFEFMSGSMLKDYNIHSGASLAWHVNFLRIQKDLPQYLAHAAKDRRHDQSVSDAINNGLRFIRNMICHRLPRDFMVLSRIQNDVLVKIGRPAGDFSFFANQLESAFFDPLLYALDEYGIPTQISSKLASWILPSEDLNELLAKLRRIDIMSSQLSPFEMKLATEAIGDL
jgi:superfamily II DNA/RNA helicase